MADITAPWSRSIAHKRHGIVGLAILLNAAATAIIVAVYRHDILLPSAPNGTEASIQKTLPVLGAIIGTVVAAINAWAISSVVTAYARTVVVAEGMSFAQMSHLHTIANAKIPFAMTPLIGLAIVTSLAEGFLPSAIVSSLTPTSSRWGSQRMLPIVDFSVDSGVQTDIVCEYYDALVGMTLPGHAYGVDCPIDDKFGDLYNVALMSLRGDVPVNSTRNGTTYPSSLMGISGAISSITGDYVRQITGDADRAVIASDYVDTCVPRMVVNAQCNKSLKEGQWFNMSYHVFEGGIPKAIIEVALCHNATNTCEEPRFAPFYGAGVSIVFWDMDNISGNTTLSLYNFATYENDWALGAVQCNIGAHEEMVPIRIRGGASVEHLPSLACPNRTQPSPHFLLNVTRMADMTIIKLQGQDGTIAPIGSVPAGRDRVQALGIALENLVATGATEMYATMYENKSLTDQWASQIPLNYVTMRTRLGSKSKHSLAFVLCPSTLTMILFAGWCIVACRSQPNLEFNPLHPASALAAGMNREELSDSVRTHDRADEAHLCRLPLILRFRPVTNERWGIDTRATPPDTMLRNDGSVYMSLENRALRDELPSPGWRGDTKSLRSDRSSRGRMY